MEGGEGRAATATRMVEKRVRGGGRAVAVGEGMVSVERAAGLRQRKLGQTSGPWWASHLRPFLIFTRTILQQQKMQTPLLSGNQNSIIYKHRGNGSRCLIKPGTTWIKPSNPRQFMCYIIFFFMTLFVVDL